MNLFSVTYNYLSQKKKTQEICPKTIYLGESKPFGRSAEVHAAHGNLVAGIA